MPRFFLLSLSLVVGLLGATPVVAQLPASEGNRPFSERRQSISEADASILRTLAEYNIRQIALAQLAMQLSTNSQLVGYARQRLIEYSTLDRKLTELAQLRQLKLPRSARTLSSTAREALLDIDSRLSDLRTPLFDQAYLDALNSDDQALAETLQPQLEKTEDAEIKTLASQNLEKVKAQQAKVTPVAKVIAAAVTAQSKAQQAAQKPAAKTPK